jgi:hypothetical protein
VGRVSDLWAVAVEEYTDRTGQYGRVHAYDLQRLSVPHPLGGRYAVHADEAWGAARGGPRCLHCTEIVGPCDQP